MTNQATIAIEEMEKRYNEGWKKVEKNGDDFFYNGWKIYPEMPRGYYEDKNSGRPLVRTVFIINGNALKGGERALLYITDLRKLELIKQSNIMGV